MDIRIENLRELAEADKPVAKKKLTETLKAGKVILLDANGKEIAISRGHPKEEHGGLAYEFKGNGIPVPPTLKLAWGKITLEMPEKKK